MENKIKLISRDIRNGKALEESIPQLLTHLADQYYTYAQVRLALHYYAFYEAYCDEGSSWSEESKLILSNLNDIIWENVLKKQSGTDKEKLVFQVDRIRKDIMKRMNMLTAYTDIFQIYEYVLNRTEYRFKEENKAVEDEEIAKEILRFLFDPQDNAIINEKIKEMVGQLPIRMTKQKYFDLLKDSIHNYIGADQASLETYLYMLRTSAMLFKEEGMEAYYPQLWEQKDNLAHLKYKDITKEEFEEAKQRLQQVSLFLETETTVYYGLQEIVNEVYAILLCSTYAGMASSDTDSINEAVEIILSDVNRSFRNNGREDTAPDIIEKFSSIEGAQEKLTYDLDILEDTLYEVDKNFRKLTGSMMLEPLLNVILYAGKLLSNSLFINLDECQEVIMADEKRIKLESDRLESEMTALFAEQDRAVSRAMMANTLNKIPVFFKNHKEVMDYVLYSFERCSDSYEKTACIEIIRSIMSE